MSHAEIAQELLSGIDRDMDFQTASLVTAAAQVEATLAVAEAIRALLDDLSSPVPPAVSHD